MRDGRGALEAPTSELMSEPLPIVQSVRRLDDVYHDLQSSPAVLVADGTTPVGVLTRADVLEWLAHASVREIALEAARRHAVRTQRLASRRRTASRAELVACIERLGCVQIDSISVVDRSQRLVLASRCGQVATDAHDALLRSGQVFEYWAHEACLLPSADEPHYRRDKRASGQFHRWFGPILQEHQALADEVMATARERDEISSRDFGGAGKGYWEWTPAKRVLDALWTAGDLAIAGRVGMERRYALPERVLPEAVLEAPEPSLEATRRMQVERAVRARGIASEARVSDYYRVKGKRRTLAPAVEELVAEGVLERLRMRELGDAWLVPAERRRASDRGRREADGRVPPVALRQPAVGPCRGRAPVRLRAPARDLQACAHPDLRLLRAAAARRPGGRRPDRREGRSQGGYAAGSGSALAAAGNGRGRCARRSGGSRMCSGSRGARSRVEFETRAIHAGQEPDPLTGSVNVPIYQTSTYAQDGVLKMRGGHDYARTINPTRTALEECLASLEGGKHGVCFSSGHGRHDRDHGVVLARLAHGRDQRRVRRHLPAVLEALRPEGLRLRVRRPDGRGHCCAQAFERPADLVWLETPSNPLLKIVDIAAVAERAHAAGAVVVVDNTFASPYLQQPLALGADIVVHSTTKYVGGHSDSVGGAAVTNDDAIAERLHFVQNSMGAVPGPLDCFLTLRGAKTLAVRMERHCEQRRADRSLARPSRRP